MLTSLLSFMPTLPSPASYLPLSLPQRVQHHLLTFLLRRSIGRFLLSELDLNTISADLTKGSAGVRGVELDCTAINPLLAGTPLLLEQGRIESISAQLRWPQLELAIQDVELVFSLHPPTPVPSSSSVLTEAGAAASTRAGAEDEGEEVDLEASILTVAEEFVHQEEREEEQDALSESTDSESVSGFVPGAFGGPSAAAATGGVETPGIEDEMELGGPQGGEKVTLLAGVIERILARLGGEIKGVVVRIKVGDGEKEVRMVCGSVVYGDPVIEEGQEVKAGKMVTVQGFDVFVVEREPVVEEEEEGEVNPISKQALAASEPPSTTEYDDSSSSSSDEDISPLHDMYLSQSIADLRQSSTLLPPPSEAASSLYASARGGTSLYASARSADLGSAGSKLGSMMPASTAASAVVEQVIVEEEEDPFMTHREDSDDEDHDNEERPKRKWRAVSPLPSSSPPTSSQHLIFSIGTLPINIYLAKSTVVSKLPSHLILLLTPPDLGTISEIVASLPPSSPSQKPSTLPPSKVRKPSPTINLSITVPSIHVVLLLPTEFPPPLSPGFWSNPSPHTPSTPHLRLTLSLINLTSRNSSTEAAVTEFKLIESQGGGSAEDEVIMSSWNGEGYADDGGKGNGLPVLIGMGEKSKKKERQSSFGSAETDAIKITLSPSDGVTVSLKPIKFQLDLTLLTRLSPLLSFIPPSASSTSQPKFSRPSTPQSLRSSTSTLNPNILDDLDQASPTALKSRGNSSGTRIFAEMVRIEIRVKESRSGAVVLDVWGANGEVGVPGGIVRGGWEKMCGFWRGPKDGKSPTPAFITLTPFPPDPSSSQPLRPSIAFVPPKALSVQIPTIHLSFTKPVLDGIQLFADDCSKLLGDVGVEQERILGSRYFATGVGVAESVVVEEEKNESEGMQIKLEVSDVAVDLFVPRKSNDGDRHLICGVADLDLSVQLPAPGKDQLQLTLLLVDIVFRDLTNSSKPRTILSRTLPRNLATGSIPVMRFGLSTAADENTGVKESRVKVDLSNFTAEVDGDVEWLEEVALFAKSPEGAFDTVVPAELTKLRLQIHDGSVLVTPSPSSTLESRLILSLSKLNLATNLMPDLPRTVIALELFGVRLLAIEGAGDLLSDPGTAEEVGWMWWKSLGYVQLVELEKSVLQLKQGNGLVLPDFEAYVSDTKVVVSLCADTLPPIAALLADVGAQAAKGTKPSLPETAPTAPARKIPTKKPSADLLSSVDPAAFRHAPSLNDTPEYLDDDVPSNTDYLADALRSSTPGRRKHRRLESSQMSEGPGHVVSDIDGETIKMLDPNGLNIIDDFLAVPREDPSTDPANAPPSILRCRLSGCDVTVHIHEGFDWQTTRKAIEDEAKAVRRRLEKIRQLLASGQAADASADEASVLMFGSVQLGLPPGASELPAGQLLAAINEELDEGHDTESNAESWQSLPGQPSTRRQTSVGRARKRLTRSSTFAIEVNLKDVVAGFETFPPENQTASKLKAEVMTLDIIDNIRTSTWRKFLTELRPSDGGVVRASGASMVRIELSKVRPEGKAAQNLQEEILLKIKLSPIRLHVDQDALDFLKAFGNFKVPALPVAPLDPDASAPVEPFFQRVEILPVKMKLDYKPKRVDYHALRQGKTAELMNFFHFDGSEMTLRHLVVTGVSGSARLSELVQDIWTPDVKANQLADVISGIAPVRSVVNLGSGVANLVLLPIEQYRKDGRLARGLQRGMTAFGRTTTLEALHVGAKLATGTQVILEQAEAVLGARFGAQMVGETMGERSGTSGSEETEEEIISRYAEQPTGVREGMEEAYRSLGDNFRSAAQTILAVPMEVYERSGSEGPVRAVVRAVPIAVLKPMIGASEAVSKALFGIRNQLDPDAQTEAADKYKSRSPST